MRIGSSRVEQTMEIIGRGCKRAMPLLRPPNIRKKAVYWCDDNIAAVYDYDGGTLELDPKDQLLTKCEHIKRQRSL